MPRVFKRKTDREFPEDNLRKAVEDVLNNSDLEEKTSFDLRLPPATRKVGEFVAVSYDDSVFPGTIVDLEPNGARVKAMVRSGRLWKWPQREDVLFYSFRDILGLLKPPSKISKSREIFSVSELM